MAGQVPKDHALDNRVRRKGSRYALYAATVIAVLLAAALTVYFIEG
jgi:hypothetical protein